MAGARERYESDSEVLVGRVAQAVGGVGASGIPGVADSVLHLWGFAVGLGSGWHPLESVFRREADTGPLLELWPHPRGRG